MVVSDNLLQNPSGAEGLDHWTTSGTITIDGGFKFTANSSMYQQFNVDPLPNPLPAKYRITASFINSETQSRISADFIKRIYAELFYEDGTIGMVQTPLRIDVTTEDHMALTWFHVTGEAPLDSTKTIDSVVVHVVVGNITGTVTLKDIHLVSLTEENGLSQSEVEELVDQLLYEGELEKLNELAAHATGFYITYDRDPVTNAIIYYQHDEPNLIDSMLIYKMAAEGFFWTDQGWDGENTQWTSGYTAAGNIVAKTLAVVGLYADWIIAGIIKSVDGTSMFIDLDEGFMHTASTSYGTKLEAGQVRFYEGSTECGKISAYTGTEFGPYFELPYSATEQSHWGVYRNNGSVNHFAIRAVWAAASTGQYDAVIELQGSSLTWNGQPISGGVLAGIGLYVQASEPSTPNTGDAWIDTNDYSRYDTISISTNTTVAESDAEVVFASGTIDVTLSNATTAGTIKKIYNDGSGTITIKNAGGTSLATIASGAHHLEFAWSGSNWRM